MKNSYFFLFPYRGPSIKSRSTFFQDEVSKRNKSKLEYNKDKYRSNSYLDERRLHTQNKETSRNIKYSLISIFSIFFIIVFLRVVEMKTFNISPSPKMADDKTNSLSHKVLGQNYYEMGLSNLENGYLHAAYVNFDQALQYNLYSNKINLASAITLKGLCLHDSDHYCEYAETYLKYAIRNNHITTFEYQQINLSKDINELLDLNLLDRLVP